MPRKLPTSSAWQTSKEREGAVNPEKQGWPVRGRPDQSQTIDGPRENTKSQN